MEGLLIEEFFDACDKVKLISSIDLNYINLDILERIIPILENNLQMFLQLD